MTQFGIQTRLAGVFSLFAALAALGGRSRRVARFTPAAGGERFGARWHVRCVYVGNPAPARLVVQLYQPAGHVLRDNGWV